MIRNNITRTILVGFLCTSILSLFGMKDGKFISDDDVRVYCLASTRDGSFKDFDHGILEKIRLNMAQKHCENNDEDIVRRKNVTRDKKFLDVKLDGSDVLFCSEKQLQALEILYVAMVVKLKKLLHNLDHKTISSFHDYNGNVVGAEISEQWFEVAHSLPLSTKEKFLICKDEDLDDLSIWVVKNNRSNQKDYSSIMGYGLMGWVGGSATYCLGKQYLQPSKFDVNDVKYVTAAAGLGFLVGAGGKLMSDTVKNYGQTDANSYELKSLFSPSELKKCKLKSEVRSNLRDAEKEWNRDMLPRG